MRKVPEPPTPNNTDYCHCSFFKKKFNLCVHICVFVYICHICVGVNGGQKRTSSSLELELYVIVSCLVWVLGNKLGSSKNSKNF